MYPELPSFSPDRRVKDRFYRKRGGGLIIPKPEFFWPGCSCCDDEGPWNIRRINAAGTVEWSSFVGDDINNPTTVHDPSNAGTSLWWDVENNRIYLAIGSSGGSGVESTGVIASFNAVTGELVHHFDTGHNRVVDCLSGDSDNIYFHQIDEVTGQNRLIAWDKIDVDGPSLWETVLTQAITPDVIIVDALGDIHYFQRGFAESYLSKVDTTGAVIYDSKTSDFFAACWAADSVGRAYVGSRNSILQYDAGTGTLLNTLTFRRGSTTDIQAFGVGVDSNSDIVVYHAAYTDSTTAQQVNLTKIDLTGTIIWQALVPDIVLVSDPSNLVIDSNDDVILTHREQRTGFLRAEVRNGVRKRSGVDGSEIWNASYMDLVEDVMTPTSPVVDASGNVYVSGLNSVVTP